MIESPVLVMLDHSLCAYFKTIWSSLTGIFGTHPSLSTSSLLTTIQHWRVEGHEMPCLDLPYVWKSPPLPYWQSCMLNVFEAAYSPAVHVILWWLADIICHDRFFKTWVATEQLGAWVCAVNTLLWAIAKCMIHIVKQQHVVTCRSLLQTGSRFLIGKNCPWLLYHSLLDVLIALFRGVQSANSKVSKVVTEKRTCWAQIHCAMAQNAH